jgi:CheY-like chemotaxis protein
MSRQKRALVVDDSKSARLILRRMLEKHGIVVDTVESAAEALEFLTVNRPDVIFMDHMMPGMNGFEAVRAIKGNPRTVTIPVMMYTSKGGDLYLGQARALGAVGVLPKTVAPAELYESLHRIGLIGERRSTRKPDEQDDENASERLEDLPRQQIPDIPTKPAPFSEVQADENGNTSIQSQLRRTLGEQRVEIRKDLLMGLDTVARQSREKLERMLDEKIDALHSQPPPPAPRLSAFPTTLLIILLFISMVWNFTSRNDEFGEINHVTANAAAGDPAQNPNGTHARRNTASGSDEGDERNTQETIKQVWHSVGWALNQDTNYPWDEIALDGARMQTVSQLLDQLSTGNFSGKLALETHAGEFCLLGDQEKGFELSGDDITLDQCDVIMNPVQATDSPSTHQSLAFANLVASSPWLQDGAITLEIIALQRSEPLVAYPPREETTKAGEWNRAAAANNRVIIRLVPE